MVILMKKIRIGIIGTGGVAQSRHIKELIACEKAQIVALCDVDPKNLEKAREKTGVSAEKCYADYRDLLADPEVDAVEICTPNCLHAEMAVAALRAGKPINLEKPVAMNRGEAETILVTAKESGTLGMTCFTYRFMPAVRYAKHLVDGGLIGDVIGLNVAYLKDSAFWEGRRLEWRFVKEKAASGVIGDLGVHLIDLAQLLAGEIREVSAIRRVVVKERMRLDSDETAPVETEDLCSFLAAFESGAEGSFHITRCAIGHKNTIRYDVYGTKGSISFDLNDPKTLTVTAGEGDPKTYEPRIETVPQEFFLTQEEAFVRAVAGDFCAYYPTLSDGAQSQRVIDAILRSADERRWVEV